MRRFSWLLLFGACGDDTDLNGDGIRDGVLDPNNVTVIAPTAPSGFVAGEIRGAAEGRPLQDVSAVVFGGGLAGSATTDASGGFQIGPLAAGATFSIRLEKSGYVDAVLSGLAIDDAAGDFPTINGALFVGPVELVPNDGAFTVQVVSEDGTPVMGAAVTIETAVRYFVASAARETGFASATTDLEGRATVSGLPNVWALPPRYEDASSLVVSVAPVDLDGDGTRDLSGTTLAVSGREARTEALVPVIVLRRAGSQPLQAIASNVAGLAGAPRTQPSIIDSTDDIRIVFNKAIDRDTVLADLRDETGATSFPVAVVTGAFDNILFIDPAEDLEPGREYNLAVRAHSLDDVPTEIVNVASPLFARDDPSQPITIIGTFVDRNRDGLWGTGDDAIELVMSTPVGRPGMTPAFRIEMLVALDFNGTSSVGDGQGELPPQGLPRPPPLVVPAAEPSPGNGAGASGITRHLAPVIVGLPFPLSRAGTSVDMEVRINADANDGRFVTTASGRSVPTVITGPLTLISP